MIAAAGVLLAAFGAGWWTSRPSSTQLTADRAYPGSARSPAPTGRATAVVDVSEHHFTVSDEVEPEDSTPEEDVRRLQERARGQAPPPEPESVMVLTGISDGPVHVAVEVREGPPAGVDLEPWEAVVDISVTAKGRLRVAEPFGGTVDLPVLNPTGPGSYRLRVHARGRDANYDGVDDEPNERYLLIAWPAPPAPDVVHELTDQVSGDAPASAAELAMVLRPSPQPPLPRRLEPMAAPPPPEITVLQRP